MLVLTREKKIGIGVAFVGCLILYVWYFYAIRYGVGRPDEAFYLTIVQRVINGDRFLLDEWHLTQFSSFFQFIPFAFFTSISGGTEGIILFMRHVYVLSSFLTYWYIFIKMRKMPIQAAICAFLFCSFVPFAIFAVEYYSLPPILLLVVCFVLIEENRHFRFSKLFFCGTLIFCVVLMVPQTAVLYLIYSAVVVYRLFSKQKKYFVDYDFVFDKRVWFGLTAGIVFCAVLFLSYLEFTGGISKILKMLPYLFADSEYDISSGGNVYLFLFYKIRLAVRMFHPINIAALIIILCAVVLFRRYSAHLKNAIYFKIGILILSCFVLISACIAAIIKKMDDPAKSFSFWFFHSFSPLPAFFFCYICYELCSKKNKRWFLFWWIGLLYSLLRDFFSDVSLGIGCILAVVPIVHFFPQLIEELKSELSEMPANKRFVSKKKIVFLTASFQIVVVISTVFFLGWNVWTAYTEGSHMLIERTNYGVADTMIDRGPYKGIYTTAGIKEIQENILSDMDKITELSEGPVFITATLPFCYLTLNRSYPVYSSWFVASDIESRQAAYWQLYPERRPHTVYVPQYDFDYRPAEKAEECFNKIKVFFDFEQVQGKAGTIVLIKKWKL